jgi:hypothetical protein
MSEREVWVRPEKWKTGGVTGTRWVLSDTLPREEALNLMHVFTKRGFEVKLTTKGGAYVTDKSW